MDAGAHRGGERDLADVPALRGCRLRPHDLVDDGRIVLNQLALGEAPLADREVHVRAAVGAVFELAGLRVAHGLADVEGDGARLRVRHQAARPQDAPEPPDVPHLVGCRDRDVEVGEALLDPLREVGGADDVRPRLLGLPRLVAFCEDGDAGLPARAVRQHQRAAELLVRVADVQPEAEVHLDRLVELRARKVLEHPYRLDGRVRPLAVDRRPGRLVALAVLCHQRSTSTPMLRAVPAMMSAA